MSIKYRQVHLDFHTSEYIEGIGSRFSPENFKKALTEGHVNSITLFSKCHHGWAYHPSEANVMHPHLDFDLLGEQLKICNELGVRTQIYLSGGFDERYLREHPEHVMIKKDGNPFTFGTPGYARICFNNSYIDLLKAQIEEIMVRYAGQFDGIFIDIVTTNPCYCPDCMRDMKARGIDTANDAKVLDFAKEVYQKYCDAVDEAVHKYVPDMPIIHNDGGKIYQGKKVFFRNTRHFELESLPTGGWGYDHFPHAAAYARTLGRDFLGMTGKFHKSWGEFGGYKHPNALRYETALSNALGAACSIGDQLHPDGEFDMATYRLIGKAYAEVEAREPYLEGSENVVDVGVISAQACMNSPYADDFRLAEMQCDYYRQDIGANRIMLEGHYLYNTLDPESDFSKFKLLILPDTIKLRGRFKGKIEEYVRNGGKLLLSGTSGLTESGEFAFDLGIKYNGKAYSQPAYLKPNYDLYPNGITSYIMYSTAHDFSLSENFSGEVLCDRVDTYFNREGDHFCSHRHTPYDRTKTAPGVVLTDSIGYIGWDIFREYAEEGAIHLRATVCDMIDKLLGEDKTLTTSLGSIGVTTLRSQPCGDGKRLVNHILYATPKLRGKNIEMIEDLPDVLNTKVTVKTDKKPSRVYTAPDGCELDFIYENGKVTYTVPKFSCAILAVIEF